MTRRVCIAVMTITLAVGACGGADTVSDLSSPALDDDIEVLGSGSTVGPGGGSVTSDDGMFTVDIPAGALAGDVEIGIAVVAPEEVGLDPTLVSQPVYELSPDGTTFDSPIAVTRTLFASGGGIAADVVPFFHVFQGSGTDWTPLSTLTARQGDEVKIRAEVDHFSANVAVASTEVWGFGLELTLSLEPGSFETPVGTSVAIDWVTDPPRSLSTSTVPLGSRDGALVSFTENEFEWIAECGENPGNGTYTIQLDGLIKPEDSDRFAITGPDAFFEAFFGATPQPQPFTIAATGNATCTEKKADAGSQTDQPAEQDVAALFQGSFGGPISFESLLDDTAFESGYLLSVLDPETADVVLTDTAKLLGVQAAQIIRAAFGGGLDPTIILSQIGPDDVGQNTFGASVDLGGGTVRIFTASDETTYSEFYIVDLTFCDGFPNTCQDVVLDIITVGGVPGLDVEKAFEDMLPYIEQRDGVAIIEGQYSWAFEGSGTLTREDGTPGG